MKSRFSSGLVGLALLATLGTGCEQKQVEVDPLQGYRVATVDMQALEELHPDHNKVGELEDEILTLRQKRAQIENASREKVIAKGGDEMQAAMEKAKQKLENERAQIDAEISGLAAHLRGKVEAEMRGLQAAYQAELKAEVERLAPPPPKPMELSGDMETQVKDYLTNLQMVRERNMAARRLELDKRVGDEIAAKKAETDGQVAAYEADLSAQYQNEKLNLQLTAQNSADETEKAAAEARLGEISGEISAAVDAKRAELMGNYAAVTAEKTAQVKSELAAYEAELDAEVQQKLAAKRAELTASMPAPPVSAGGGPPPEIQAKIRQVEARMQAELASKKASLEGQMKAKMADSEARLKKKADEVEAQLKKLQAEIEERINKALANLPDEVKAEIKGVEDKIAKLEEERNKLRDSLREDINGQVAGIAEKKGQEMVLGIDNFVCPYKDPSFEDLTDLSQVRVQQMESGAKDREAESGAVVPETTSSPGGEFQ